MGKLFKIEMIKLKNSTAMRVLLIVAASLSVFSVLIMALVNSFAEELLSVLGMADGYSMAKSLVYEDSSDTMLMVVILMAVLIGGDFSARTLQTQIAAGYSRFQVIISRFLSLMVSYIIIHVVYFVISVAGATMVFGFGVNVTGAVVGEILLNLLLGFLMAMTMLSMYMLFAFLLKSTGGIIGVCLPCMLIGTSILSGVSLVSEEIYTVMSFTPFGQSWELTNEINSSLFGLIAGIDGLNPAKFIAVCVIWTATFIYLTFISFRKAELK